MKLTPLFVGIGLLCSAYAHAQSTPADFREVELRKSQGVPPPAQAPQGVVTTEMREEPKAYGLGDRRRNRRGAAQEAEKAASGVSPSEAPPIPAAILGDYSPAGDQAQEAAAPAGAAQEPAQAPTPTSASTPASSQSQADAPKIELPPSVLEPGQPVPVYPTLAHAAAAGVDPFADKKPAAEPEPPAQVAPAPEPEPAPAQPAWKVWLQAHQTLLVRFAVAAAACVGLAWLAARRFKTKG